MSEKSSLSKESSLRRRRTTTGYHYRRRSKALFTEQYTAELKHVLGLTSKTNSSFSCDPNTGLLAYPAGCVIVLLSPKSGKQTHIINPGQKTLTCLQFSGDGNFIVTGESGHQPCTRVFSVVDRCQIGAFASHKYGISCVAFSPNAKYVISVGFQHDNVINVWDWKKNKLAASNKVSTKIKSVAFAGDGSYFITVGNRHVKFWYLENPSTDKTTIPLRGRSVILETLRNQVFSDVVCGIDGTTAFAVTKSGVLCQFSSGRSVEKFAELKCGNARSLCALDDMILCGCGSGSVHVFNAQSLEFITEIFPLEQLRGTEIVAISIDIRNLWMHCVFTDHALVVYDIVDLSRPKVQSLFQYHSTCVWDVKVLPWSNESNSLPVDCFITCSNDGTARAWQCNDNLCKLLKIINLSSGLDNRTSDASSKYEARSLSVRSDASHLAVGDRSGNIHVYDLANFEKVAFIPTHEGEVLCMDYSLHGDMLASASRDRCVHTFDACYNPTHTIADHSAAVTAVKFAQQESEHRLITCGSDKSLYFCSISASSGKKEINREQHFVEKHSMSDMAVLDESVIVACGCNLHEYDVIEGKVRRSFRGNESSVGIVRVTVNSHRTLIATSCADKHIYVLGFTSTECLCVLTGHSEVAMALAFDLENRLLSASADGCLFIWLLHHRIADDSKVAHYLNNNNSNSAATTPGSPGPDRTACFEEVAPANKPKNLADELEATALLNSESISGFSLDNDVDEDLKIDPFKAVRVKPISDANASELPTWVTKVISNDSDIATNATPRPAMGKWGRGLEVDKLCEELGNLPVLADISSVRGSIDYDETAPEISAHTSTADEKTQGSNGDDLMEKTFSITDVELKGSDDKHWENHEQPGDLAQSNIEEEGDEVASSFSAPGENALPSESCLVRLSGLRTEEEAEEIEAQSDAIAENASLSPRLAHDFENNEKRNSLSLQEELLNAAGSVERPLDSTNDQPSGNVEAQQNKLGLVEAKAFFEPVSDPAFSVSTTDEDVDLREVLRLTREDEKSHEEKAEENIGSVEKPCSSVFKASQLANGEHKMHSTPKSHYTATVNIELSPPQKAKLVTKPKANLSPAKRSPSKAAAVDTASKDLVNKVIASVENEQHESGSATKISESNLESCNAAVLNDANHSKTETNPGEKSLKNNLAEESDVAGPNVNQQPNPHRTSNLTISCSKPRVSKHSERPSMPPAFVEFLASLTKKKSPRNFAFNHQNPLQDISHHGKHESRVRSPRKTSLQESNYQNDEFEDQPPTSVNRRASEVLHLSSSSRRPFHDEVDECQKASNDLIKIFDRAEALYLKQKKRHEQEGGLSNGSLVGFHKLTRSLQSIYSRLSRLRTVSNSIHPEPELNPISSRSVSLDNLSTDSPVVNLLREYSDKLVGLVHNQVDTNLLNTPADTV